jgi:peptide/nickel transport system permease protein
MAAVANPHAPPGLWRVLASRPTVVIGLLVLMLIVVAAIAAPWISPHDPYRLSIANRLKPPSGRFWFGTDEFGYDIFSRMLVAGRLSLLVGFGVV